MGHVDPDILTLAALGEMPLDGAADHLRGCDECGPELERLSRVVAVGRATTPADIPTAPPAAVWERIREELGLPTEGEEAASTLRTVSESAEPLAPRRRISGWLALAASVGVVAGGVGGAMWATGRSPAEPPATILAEATLDALPGWDASGVAEVRQVSDGARVVIVELDAQLGTDGFREVWLLAPDLSGMVSLGLLDGTEGEFVVPAGIDLDRYSVVDVSEEPFDGDATHSGNSIVRGAVEA